MWPHLCVSFFVLVADGEVSNIYLFTEQFQQVRPKVGGLEGINNCGKPVEVCKDYTDAEFEAMTKGMFKSCAEAKAAGMCEKAGPACDVTCGTCSEGSCKDFAPAAFEEATKGMFKSCAEAKAAEMCEKAGPMCDVTCGTCPEPEPCQNMAKEVPICKDYTDADFQAMTKGMFKSCAEAKAAGMCEKAGPACDVTCNTCSSSGPARRARSGLSVLFSFKALEVLALGGPLQGPATPNQQPLQYALPETLLLPRLQEMMLLNQMYLEGPMPLVWQTKEIRLLVLVGAPVHGPMPQSMEDMPMLESFAFEGVQGLTGAMPNIFRTMTPLHYVSIVETSLEGDFPRVQGIKTLQQLIVRNNKFTESGPGQSQLEKSHTSPSSELCLCITALFKGFWALKRYQLFSK